MTPAYSRLQEKWQQKIPGSQGVKGKVDMVALNPSYQGLPSTLV